jgi:hypothetical protein
MGTLKQRAPTVTPMLEVDLWKKNRAAVSPEQPAELGEQERTEVLGPVDTGRA